MPVLITTIITFLGCSARESQRALSVQATQSYRTEYAGSRPKLVIGEFENRSRYMNGIFADETDRLAIQARQILKTHISQSGRFRILDRVNMKQAEREAEFSGTPRQVTGGDYILTGAVTEFGRRDVGRRDAIFHRSKTQVAYAKVSVSILDVRDSAVVCSYQGAGEFDLTDRSVLGFGSVAGYDATLTDKVLNLAMIEVVERMVEGLDLGEWEHGG